MGVCISIYISYLRTLHNDRPPALEVFPDRFRRRRVDAAVKEPAPAPGIGQRTTSPSDGGFPGYSRAGYSAVASAPRWLYGRSAAIRSRSRCSH